MIDDDERREIAASMTDTYRFGDWVAYDPGEGVCALLSLFAEGRARGLPCAAERLLRMGRREGQ